jgi:hypothetical protein
MENKTEVKADEESRVDQRKEAMTLRMSRAERELYLAAAKWAGVPMSVWMRERMRRAAIVELREAGIGEPILHVGAEIRRVRR